MDVPALVGRIEAELAGLAVPGRAEHERRYLKSGLTHLGVPVPAIRRVARRAVSGPIERPALLELAGALWRRPVHELRMVAIELLAGHAALLQPADMALTEQMIREGRGWVYVDPLAQRVAGALVSRHPEQARTLDRWADDEDFWVRRSALLALLPGVRAGTPDLARLSRYGDAVLPEREFFLRKALGWVLRELSTRDPEWVRGWVAARTDRISGVTFREAVRHLGEPDREALTAAFRARPRR